MKIKSVLIACAVALAFTAQGAGAEEGKGTDSSCPLNVYGSLGVYSKYVFRGIDLYDSTSLQPSIGATYDMGDAGRLNANIWMQIPGDTTDNENIDLYSEVISTSSLNSDEIFSPSKRFVELDPTISWDITEDIATFTVGHTWYTDPQDGDVNIRVPVVNDAGEIVPLDVSATYSRGDTAEFFASLALDIVLNPEITVVKDYRKYEYWYYTLGLSQPISVTKDEGFVLIPFTTFAWATNTPENDGGNFSTNYTRDGLEHINVGLKGRMSSENWTLTPVFTYVFTLDANEGEDDIVWAGFDLGWAS